VEGWGEEYDGGLLKHCCRLKPEVRWPLELVEGWAPGVGLQVLAAGQLGAIGVLPVDGMDGYLQYVFILNPSSYLRLMAFL
jgi:hypothetical protein